MTSLQAFKLIKIGPSMSRSTQRRVSGAETKSPADILVNFFIAIFVLHNRIGLLLVFSLNPPNQQRNNRCQDGDNGGGHSF